MIIDTTEKQDLPTARYFPTSCGATLRYGVHVSDEEKVIRQCYHCDRDFATIRIWIYHSNFCSVDCCLKFQESMGGPYNWHESPPSDWKELAAGENDE